MKKIDKGTIIRTAVLVLAIINNVLALFGKSPLPFDNEQLTAVISYGFTIAAALAAWWKDNGFTKAGITGQAVTKAIKKKQITCEDVDKLLNK